MINGGRIARLGRPKLLVLGGLTLSLASSLMLPFSAHLHDHTGPSSFPPLSSAQQEPPSSLSSPTLRSSGPLHPIGSSATTSIQASVDERANAGPGFTGRSAALWFVVAYVVLGIVAVGVFYREERSLGDLEAKTLEVEQVEVKEAIALAVPTFAYSSYASVRWTSNL
ncbi:hypothetical protein FRC08_001953 [Ceratobasidium sp. 394]|nr:hypothetical protein FRC08_001953 [Ceratobasidium sp. 394]